MFTATNVGNAILNAPLYVCSTIGSMVRSMKIRIVEWKPRF